MQSTRYRVEGMTCEGCARTLTRVMGAAGLQAEVDLAHHAVTVHGPHDPGVVQRAVENAGFDHGGPLPPHADASSP